MSKLSSSVEKNPQGLKGRLASGLSAKTFTLITLIITQILLLPFFIHAWGADTYQSWLVILSAASLISLGEFGIGSYLRPAIRMAGAADDTERVNRLLAISVVIYTVVISFLFLAVILFLFLVDLFNFFDQLNIRKEQVIIIFFMLAISKLLMLPINPLTGLSHGYGEQGRAELFFGGMNAGQIVVTICLLLFGMTPVWVAGGHFGVTFLTFVLRIYDAKRRHPQVRFSVAVPTKSELREAVKLSGLHVMTTWKRHW